MASALKHLHRIDGATGAPTSAGPAGQLCLNFPNAAGTHEQPELWACDGSVWRRVNPHAGSQLRIHGSVADAAALNAVVATWGPTDAGKFVYQEDTGVLYYYDGHSISNVGTIRGAAGPTGPTGATGPTGLTGAAGPAGKDAYPVARHDGTISSGRITVTLDGRAQTFNVTSNVTAWTANLPSGANTANFEYGKRVDLLANGTRTVSFPSNWRQMGPVNELNMGSGDYAIVILSTFKDGTVAYTAQVNE